MQPHEVIKAFPEWAAGCWALQRLGRSGALQTSMASRSFFGEHVVWVGSQMLCFGEGWPSGSRLNASVVMVASTFCRGPLSGSHLQPHPAVAPTGAVGEPEKYRRERPVGFSESLRPRSGLHGQE